MKQQRFQQFELLWNTIFQGSPMHTIDMNSHSLVGADIINVHRLLKSNAISEQEYEASIAYLNLVDYFYRTYMTILNQIHIIRNHAIIEHAIIKNIIQLTELSRNNLGECVTHKLQRTLLNKAIQSGQAQKVVAHLIQTQTLSALEQIDPEWPPQAYSLSAHRSNHNDHPLLTAIFYKNSQAVQRLYDKGLRPDIRKPDSWDITPLEFIQLIHQDAQPLTCGITQYQIMGNLLLGPTIGMHDAASEALHLKNKYTTIELCKKIGWWDTSFEATQLLNATLIHLKHVDFLWKRQSLPVNLDAIAINDTIRTAIFSVFCDAQIELSASTNTLVANYCWEWFQKLSHQQCNDLGFTQDATLTHSWFYGVEQRNKNCSDLELLDHTLHDMHKVHLLSKKLPSTVWESHRIRTQIYKNLMGNLHKDRPIPNEKVLLLQSLLGEVFPEKKIRNRL